MFSADARAIAEVTGGELLSGEPSTVARGVVIDSREVVSGCAFVAFSGERVDGHAYLAEAGARGARVVLVTRHDESVRAALEASGRRDLAVIHVNDALAAVQALAVYHRGRLSCPVIGITGSTGKTTTKDLMRAVLAPLGTVVATTGNRNNELGLPLTVLQAGPGTDALVLEMAMRGQGQIAGLARIARPHHGLITNVGVSHIETMGSVEAIASAKGELVEAIPPEGTVFLNGDDVASEGLSSRARGSVVRYGLAGTCDVRATDVRLDDDGTPVFILVAAEGSAECSVPVPGRHNVYNALASAAVALRLGVTPADIASSMAGAEMTVMRMEVVDTASGVTVVNDAYNANPVSMRAALRTLAEMRVRGRRVAVLGAMAELGSLTELSHFEVGEEVARLGIDVLVTVGDLGTRIAEGARAEGAAPDAVRACATAEEAVEVLDDLLEPGDTVLVKASRVIGLERVVEGIVDPRV